MDSEKLHHSSEQSHHDAALKLKRQKKVFIETWGCQMNVVDSERMLGDLLRTSHYALADSAKSADVIILNTCTIREKAKHKVISRLGVLRELKKKKKDLKIVVAGCLAQSEGADLLKLSPDIDLLIGPGKLKDLPMLLESIDSEHPRFCGGLDRRILSMKIPTASPSIAPIVAPIIALGFETRSAEASQYKDFEDFEAPPTLTGKNEISRYIDIVQGCENFCSYCIVPYTRGPVCSKRPEDVVLEANTLVKAGAREITLLGQNVNSYGLDLVSKGTVPQSDESPFVHLVKEVIQIPDLLQLRFTTSNPFDFTKDIADLFGKYPKIGRYLHLPIQSGSDNILIAMNRKITAKEYLEKIAWLYMACPDMAISTDFIVGFPGETDDDFEQTLNLVKRAQFSFIFSFKYSIRKGTPAAALTEQVPEDVKEKRLAKLNKVQDDITIRQHYEEIGRIRNVLFHYESPKMPGVFYGRSEHFRLVRLKTEENPIGKLLPVKITGGNKTALIAELI